MKKKYPVWCKIILLTEIAEQVSYFNCYNSYICYETMNDEITKYIVTKEYVGQQTEH